MKMSIVTRKWIKPRTPTPQNLKNYHISFRDELSPPSNVGVVLFYRSTPSSTAGLLEESLSRILPQFYPLAGRYIKEDYRVDCSDEGVEFVEARASDVDEEVDDLLPRRTDDFVGRTDPLLSVQITELIDRGGIAIGVSVSHRIFDASSIATFLAAWANATRIPTGEISIVPSFHPRFLFPGKKRSYYSKTKQPPETTVVSKRFSFSNESIRNLRSKVKPNQEGSNTAPSKVRVVSALIAKALIRIDEIRHGRPRPCLIIQAIDIRHRTIPPLPQHSCGNLAIHAVAKCVHAAAAATDGQLGMQEITCMISDSIEKTVADCAEILSGGDDTIIDREAELIRGLRSSEVNDVWFTDWSKSGLYEVDFGWGKPASVGTAPVPYERVTVLMNNGEGDGIEAWVHLRLDDMLTFQEDEEIKLSTKT